MIDGRRIQMGQSFISPSKVSHWRVVAYLYWNIRVDIECQKSKVFARSVSISLCLCLFWTCPISPEPCGQHFRAGATPGIVRLWSWVESLGAFGVSISWSKSCCKATMWTRHNTRELLGFVLVNFVWRDHPFWDFLSWFSWICLIFDAAWLINVFAVSFSTQSKLMVPPPFQKQQQQTNKQNNNKTTTKVQTRNPPHECAPIRVVPVLESIVS